MKNAGMTGAVALVGIGLVLNGLGDPMAERVAFAAPAAKAGSNQNGCSIWTCTEKADGIYVYDAGANISEPGQSDWAQMWMEISPNYTELMGQWGSGSSLSSVSMQMSSSGFDFTGNVSIADGDFTFPAGSTLAGETDVVSLQDMHAQVQDHAGLHGQHLGAIEVLQSRVEALEGILESLPDCTCASDVNLDGAVDAADLGLVIGAWGSCR